MLPLRQEISDIWNKVSSLDAGVGEARILMEIQVKVTQKLTKKVDQGYKELVELASSFSEEMIQKLTKVLKTNGITQEQTTRYNGMDQEGKPDEKGKGRLYHQLYQGLLERRMKLRLFQNWLRMKWTGLDRLKRWKDLKEMKSWLDIQLGIQEPLRQLLE